MLYLVRKRTSEQGETTLDLVMRLQDVENTTYEIIHSEVDMEDRPDEYGEYYWDNDTNTLSVQYLPKEIIDRQNTIQELKRRITELEQADQNLGIDITDLDIRQLEHEMVYHSS